MDARRIEFDEIFDIAISLFHVMSYMNTNEDIINVFLSLRKVLKKGSLFIFDCWYGLGVLSDKPTISYKKFEDEHKIITRIATPNMNDKKNSHSKYE